MKQLKKMLCVLLAVIMVMTTLTVGVSAAPADLSKRGGVDVHGENILTSDQRATLLLNYLDQVLLEQNITFNLDLVVTSINIDLRSIDLALDSVCNLINSNLFNSFKDLLGDLKYINTTMINNVRRRTAGIGDIDVVFALIQFVNLPASNLAVVYKFLRGEIDMGVVGNFVDVNSLLDLSGTIRDALYKGLINSSASACPPGTTADNILQSFVDRMLLGGNDTDGVYQEGYLPSMSGKTNIYGYSLYQFVENAANAFMADYVMPDINTKFKRQIKELCGYTFENDQDMVGDDSNVDPRLKEYINFDYNFTGYTWGGEKGIFGQINDFIDTVLGLIWKGEDFWVAGDNSNIKENLRKLACILYDEIGEDILPKNMAKKTSEEIHSMSAEALVCYVVTGFIEREFDYIKFDKEFSTLEELGCYVLMEVAAEIIPFQNYKAKIDNGQATAGLDFALDIAADIGVYYLNAYTTMNLQYGVGFTKTLSQMIKWALKVENYGGFFTSCGVDVNAITDPFDALDKTAFSMIPLSLFNVSSSKDFIMNHIVKAALDLDFDSLFSLFYKTSDSPYNKTAFEFVIWLANSILNVVCGKIGNVIPASVSVGGQTYPLNNVEAIISKYGIADIAGIALQGLYRQGSDILKSAVQIISPLMGLEDNISWLDKDAAPAGYANKTIEQLKQFAIDCNLNFGTPDNGYSTDVDDWNTLRDYDYYTYGQFESALSSATDYVMKYETWVGLYNQGQTDIAPAVDQKKVNDLYYTLDKYFGRLEQAEASTAQLYYVIEQIDKQGYKKANYPEEVWSVFKKAYDFAVEVNDIPLFEDEDEEIPYAKQSMINSARRKLIIAWKVLVNPRADYTQLKALVEAAEKIDLSKYTDESANFLKEAIRYYKEDFSKVLSADEQGKVDDLVKKIQFIIDNLVEAIIDSDIIPAIEGVVVDTVSGMIKGLEEGLDKAGLLDFITTSNGGEVKITTPDGSDAVGTGTKVELINNGEVTSSFDIIVFGDLSGDGIASEEDFALIDLYNSWAIDFDYDSCYFKAGELNGDDEINEMDLTIIDLVDAWAVSIDQKNPTELIYW